MPPPCIDGAFCEIVYKGTRRYGIVTSSHWSGRKNVWVPDTVEFANRVDGYEPAQPLHSAGVKLATVLMWPSEVLHLMRKVIDGNKWIGNRHYRPTKIDFPDSPEPAWADPVFNGKDSAVEHRDWTLENGSIHLFKTYTGRNRLGIVTKPTDDDWKIEVTTESGERHKVWYKSMMWLASAQQCADVCFQHLLQR